MSSHKDIKDCVIICNRMVTLGAGQGQYIELPVGVELWFSVVIQAQGTLTSGDVTFGSMFQDASTQYYSVANHGFKTVGFASIPSKSTTTPTKAVVDFTGQCATGKFGIINNTDAPLQLNVNAVEREIGNK